MTPLGRQDFLPQLADRPEFETIPIFVDKCFRDLKGRPNPHGGKRAVPLKSFAILAYLACLQTQLFHPNQFSGAISERRTLPLF
jgi:hypothetical protein